MSSKLLTSSVIQKIYNPVLADVMETDNCRIKDIKLTVVMSNISFTSIFYLCIRNFRTANMTILFTNTVYFPSKPIYLFPLKSNLIEINKKKKM